MLADGESKGTYLTMVEVIHFSATAAELPQAVIAEPLKLGT